MQSGLRTKISCFWRQWRNMDTRIGIRFPRWFQIELRLNVDRDIIKFLSRNDEWVVGVMSRTWLCWLQSTIWRIRSIFRIIEILGILFVSSCPLEMELNVERDGRTSWSLQWAITRGRGRRIRSWSSWWRRRRLSIGQRLLKSSHKERIINVVWDIMCWWRKQSRKRRRGEWNGSDEEFVSFRMRLLLCRIEIVDYVVEMCFVWFLLGFAILKYFFVWYGN